MYLPNKCRSEVNILFKEDDVISACSTGGGVCTWPRSQIQGKPSLALLLFPAACKTNTVT